MTQPKYSGPASAPFWRRVRRLGPKGDVVYALGCALQDLECRTLNELVNAEVEKRVGWPGTRAVKKP